MDSLQTLWHSAQKQEDESGLSVDQLKQITQQKSRQEFDRFKRVIRWEMIANIPIVAALLYWSTEIEVLNNPFILSLTAVVMAAYMIWQYRFYRRIQRHQPQEDVQTYLTVGLSIMKQYMRSYQAMIIFSIFFGGFIGFWIVYNNNPANPPLLFSDDPLLNLAYSALFAISLFMAAHFYTKYAYRDRIGRMQRYQDKSALIQQLVTQLQQEA